MDYWFIIIIIINMQTCSCEHQQFSAAGGKSAFFQRSLEVQSKNHQASIVLQHFKAKDEKRQKEKKK